jgi:hypothetical protein
VTKSFDKRWLYRKCNALPNDGVAREAFDIAE